MNIKQFFFLVALYCALHLTACYLQWRDRQRWHSARKTFTLMFDITGVYGWGKWTGVFTGVCWGVWFCSALGLSIWSLTTVWWWLA